MFRKAAFFFLFSSLSFAQEPDLISLGAGVFEIVRHNKNMTADFRIEYESHLSWHKIRPIVGLMGTAKGSSYLYAGFGIDWIIKDRLVFSPNFAAGWYRAGGGKDLGFPLEFRSGIVLAWRFKNASRIGAHFYHISNASLGYKNPGEESLDFFFAIPIP